MSAELPVVAPHITGQVEAIRQPLEAPPAAELAPRSPEELRAVEAVFSHDQQEEQHLVAGLLGMWVGASVLHDVAVETFQSPPEEEEEKKPRRKDRPERAD